jgi:hypothetical protein
VATANKVNHVVTILEICATNSMEWVSRRGLQFANAKTEAVLFKSRSGHRKLLRQKLTAKTRVGNGSVLFNASPTHCLGIWMDSHLMFKEYYNRCTKKPMAAEARIRLLAKTYDVVP